MTESLSRSYIEQHVPLSASVIWQWQLGYYQQAGLQAWQEVPFHITNNPAIGEHYAHILYSALLDLLPRLDVSQPLYLLELGAGAGAFCFYCLQGLQARLSQHPQLSQLPWVYVATDAAEANIEFMEAHPALQPFIQSGHLDFSIFQAPSQQSVWLRKAQRLMASVEQPVEGNPVLLLANYVFDTLRHDRFEVTATGLEQVLYSSFYDAEPLSQPGSSGVGHVGHELHHHPISWPHYPEPAMDELLQYAQSSFNPGSFFFPLDPIRVLAWLKAIASDGFILLCSDKANIDSLVSSQDRGYARHGGAFSIPVSLELLQRWLEGYGGQVFKTTSNAMALKTLFALCLPEGTDAPLRLEQTHSFMTYIFDALNPPNEWLEMQWLLNAVEDRQPLLAYEGALSLIRTSFYNPILLEPLAEKYHHRPPLKPNEQVVLYDLLQSVERRLYGAGQNYHPYYWCSYLYAALGHYTEALRVLDTMVQHIGEVPQTWPLNGDLLSELGHVEAAVARYQQYLAYLDQAPAQGRDDDHRQVIVEEINQLLQRLNQAS